MLEELDNGSGVLFLSFARDLRGRDIGIRRRLFACFSREYGKAFFRRLCCF